MGSYIFLSLIGIIGLLSKNKIVFYAAITLLILKLIPNSSSYLSKNKSFILRLGIYIITISVFIPISSSEIGFRELLLTLKSKESIVALLVGVFASIVATKGIYLQTMDPQIVIFVSLGVVAGVVFVGGSAVGPIIASGLTYIVLKIIEKVI